MIELASRSKTQPPPPGVVWDTLADPHRPATRQWLSLAKGEVQPTVIESNRPSLVVWSSLWPERPLDQIRFDITSDEHGGSLLKWVLVTDDDAPGDAMLGQMRYRINYLINSEMRYSFGQ
jgi:hypothetical protein